jgi:uncharacterized protein (TIRG00374 family)
VSAIEQPVTVLDPTRRRRQIVSGVIYFAVAAFAIFVVLPQFLGKDKEQMWPLAQAARIEWLALAILCEAVRYFCFGLVARQISLMLRQPLTRRESAQMMLSSHSVNRLLPSGGLVGFAVRFLFFAKYHFPFGRTLGLLITQNVVSGAVLLCTYMLGISFLLARELLTGWQIVLATSWLGVVSSVAVGQVYLGLRPQRLERVAAWWLRHMDRGVSGILKRTLYNPSALQKFLHDFSQSVHTTMRQPRGLLVAWCWQALAVTANITTLVCVFQALQVPIEIGVVIGAYIIAYYAQLALPNPGEAGSFEAMLSTTLVFLGVDGVAALTATLLFRFTSYWLPIPFGVLAYLNLKRQGKV